MARGGVSSISTQWELGQVGTLVIRACGRGWGACRAKRGVWVEKLENRAWNRELVRAAYASPRRPRWLGGTLAAWLGLGDAGAAHRHGLGCDFGYDFSQMTKMCIVTPIVGGSTEFGTRPAHGVGAPRGAGGRAAAFHTSLPGLESVVPIGACLGAQRGQQGWCCYRCCLGGGK